MDRLRKKLKNAPFHLILGMTRIFTKKGLHWFLVLIEVWLQARKKIQEKVMS